MNCAYDQRRKAARLLYTDQVERVAGAAEDQPVSHLWEAVPDIGTKGCYTGYLSEDELEQGLQTLGSTGTSFQAVEQPEEGYTLRIYTYDGGTLLWEKPVKLATIQALDMTETSRTFDEGTVTALVSRDGRLLDLYPDRTVEDGSTLASVYATDVIFIGASGQHYPAQMLSDGTGAWTCNAPQEETITAVEIGSLRLTRIYLDDGVQREIVPVTYGDLNWLIPVGWDPPPGWRSTPGRRAWVWGSTGHTGRCTGPPPQRAVGPDRPGPWPGRAW